MAVSALAKAVWASSRSFCAVVSAEVVSLAALTHLATSASVAVSLAVVAAATVFASLSAAPADPVMVVRSMISPAALAACWALVTAALVALAAVVTAVALAVSVVCAVSTAFN